MTRARSGKVESGLPSDRAIKRRMERAYGAEMLPSEPVYLQGASRHFDEMQKPVRGWRHIANLYPLKVASRIVAFPLAVQH
jgi:hypothetical protein